MPESLHPQPSSEDGEYSLDYLLNNPDVNTPEPVISSRYIEKKKSKPTLIAGLEQVYSNPTENSPQLMNGLHQASDEFLELNSKLRMAKKEYLGCKTLLDFTYYGPATIHMLNQLINRNVSWWTIPEAAILSGAATIVLIIANSSIKESDKQYRTYNMYSEYRDNVKKLRDQLEYTTKKVKVHLKFLGLGDFKELKHDQISRVVERISEFFDEKEIEEEILKRTNSGLDQDKLL